MSHFDKLPNEASDISSNSDFQRQSRFGAEGLRPKRLKGFPSSHPRVVNFDLFLFEYPRW